MVEKGLAKLGIETQGDLLNYFPRAWDDYSQITKIRNIRPGKVAVQAQIETINTRRSFRKRLTITEAILTDGTGTINATWFNQPYLAQTLQTEQDYLFAGTFEFKSNHLSLNSPTFEKIEAGQAAGRIFPIYRENKVINSKILTKLVRQCLSLTKDLNDSLPKIVEQEYELMAYGNAVMNLHQPTSPEKLEAAKKRIGFGELFMLIATGLVIKNEIKTEISPQIPFDLDMVKKVLGQLSFELTDAQRKAAWTIFQDQEGEQPMNRLLEGDVGSGKTLVALLAAALTIKAGYQAALMVPTEILARQHLETAQTLLEPLGVKVKLLVASLKLAEKKNVQAEIASGKVDLVIGTHSLLGERTEFSKLGLVIIDEQHRFGVNQRRELKTKASVMPHVLTMTATPIPRTLALIIYGDLDISIIDELPPGRKPISTKLAFDAHRTEVYRQIDERLAAGEQAFVVCPLIDPSDKTGSRSVSAEHQRLSQSVFAHRKITMLHGRMKPEEKEQIMQAFKAGKHNILISTTVVEVGVDIPNATVMVVEDADRFGLAALHQLRGRVGRSGLQSHCYLFTASDNPQTLQRLHALEKSNDGFRLSQIDLQTRGPGEIYGARQHGILDLRLADIFDTKQLALAREAAQAFLTDENMVKYPQTMKRINELKKLTTLD